MQPKEIFKREEENSMSTTRLFEELLTRAELEKKKQSPLPLFYRSKRELSTEEQNQFVDNGFDSTHAASYVGKILCSSGHHEDIPKDIIDDIIKSGDEEDNWGADKRIPQSLSD
jgi:hypothetical protein